jgi:hypothetical protein
VLIARNVPGAEVHAPRPAGRDEARWMFTPGVTPSGTTANLVVRF